MLKNKSKIAFLLCIPSISFSATLAFMPFHVTGSPTAAMVKNITVAIQQFQQQYPTAMAHPNTAYLQNAKTVVKNAVKPFGYFNAQVQLRWKNARDKLNPYLSIQTGRPIKIRSIQINIKGAGATDPAFKRIKKKSPLKVNHRLITPLYNNLKDKLFNAASKRGYFKAKMIKSVIYINRHQYFADIKIVFNTGSRYYFGKTHFNSTAMATGFLKRFLAYHPGKLYNSHLIQLSQQRLNSSGYFQQVQIIPDINHTQNRKVPINISLKLVTPRTYIIGLGYGTDTGIRAVGNMTQNFKGKWGHKISLGGQLAENNTNIKLNYTIPGKKPYQNQYSLTGALSKMNQATGNSEAIKLSGNYRSTHGHWNNLYSINLLNENYNLSTLKVKTNANLIYPSASWQYLNSDNKLNPSRGFLAQFKLYGTPDFLSTKGHFFQAKIFSRFLTTFSLTHTRLLLTNELAHTEINSIENVPLSLQLFAGGSHSIRGYGYNSIGPARNLWITSVELQQKLYRQLYLTGFYDMGNVAPISSLFSKAKKSVGGGFAWLSPIGMFELDYAIALNLPGHPGKIEFSMGPFL